MGAGNAAGGTGDSKSVTKKKLKKIFKYQLTKEK